MFLDLFGFYCFMFLVLKIDLNFYFFVKMKIVSIGFKGWLNNNLFSVNRYLVFFFILNILVYVMMDVGEVFFVMFCDWCVIIY